MKKNIREDVNANIVLYENYNDVEGAVYKINEKRKNVKSLESNCLRMYLFIAAPKDEIDFKIYLRYFDHDDSESEAKKSLRLELEKFSLPKACDCSLQEVDSADVVTSDSRNSYTVRFEFDGIRYPGTGNYEVILFGKYKEEAKYKSLSTRAFSINLLGSDELQAIISDNLDD